MIRDVSGELRSVATGTALVTAEGDLLLIDGDAGLTALVGRRVRIRGLVGSNNLLIPFEARPI